MPALNGLRLFDFSHLAAGRFCTGLSADTGAEVINFLLPQCIGYPSKQRRAEPRSPASDGLTRDRHITRPYQGSSEILSNIIAARALH